MKKLLSILLLAALLFSLAGCAGRTTTVQTTSESKNALSISGKLTFVTWNGAQEASLRNAIDGFNKKYSSVTVELQITPWSEYWTKLEASATSGGMPDIMTNHVIYSQVYAEAGMLLPLDETELKKYDPDFTYANYVNGVTDIYKYNGVNYGVPKDIDCIVLAYNKTLFDMAGLEYPSADWTWDDLLTAAEKLTDKDKGIYGFAAYNNIQEGYGSLIYQNGGYILSPDKKSSGLNMIESKDAMQMYIDMIYKYGYSPSTAQLAETDRRTLFSSGKVAMLNVGNWQLSGFVANEDIKDKFDIAPLAKIKGSAATISNGLAHSVSANTKNPDAAKAFVAYMGSKEGMELTAIGPAVPIYKGVDAVWADYHKNDFNTSVVVNSIPNGVPYPATISRSKWEAAINKYIEKVFNGEMTVEDAFDQAAKEMNDFLVNE